jgi:hypothetical protein
MNKDEIISELTKVSECLNNVFGDSTRDVIDVRHLIEAISALSDPKELSRDELASVAMNGLLSSEYYGDKGSLSDSAYETADAMIKARTLTPNN